MMECPQGYKRINATFCQGTIVPTIDGVYFEYQFYVTNSLLFITWLNECSTLDLYLGKNVEASFNSFQVLSTP